jgi:acetylornithine deacetylase/succinyl-diaminopimelate desuccinylase-like protein
MTYEPNWDAVGADAVSRLQSLIRIDTTNPPGNEVLAAEWIADLLSEAGYAPTVLESEPGRGTVVARLPGTGTEPPLLLMSHIDVVPAEPDEWEHPPFAAEIHDGYVWGRGALDMKNIVAQHLTLMLLFKERAAEIGPLPRDLIIMSAADEERGGELGARFMVNNHPDLIHAEYALNEGGGQAFEVGGRLYMTLQTAEKGLARFRLTASGAPGHASMPRDDNAVVRLAEAVAAVGRAKLPAHLTDTVRGYLRTMADTQSEEIAGALRVMAEDESKIDDLIATLPVDDQRKRYLYAITHNTASPTVLEAGSKVNVFPSSATARVDGRTLPGFASEDLRAELTGYLPDGIELVFEEQGAPLESGLHSPLYDAIAAATAEHAPEVTLVPTLLAGATDAKAVVRLGTKVYGFSPQRYEPEVDRQALVHGHNERISLDNQAFATRVLYDVVKRFCRE